MHKYFIKTFGCQMNVSDSERIAAIFQNFGLSETESISDAHVAVFNTCGVRQMAEDRVYGQVHNLRKSNPKMKIIITGCLANRKDVQRRLKNKADLFCEINNFEKEINKFLKTKYETCLPAGKVRNTEYERDYLSIIPKHKTDFTAYVPIMTGCNNFCSYCVVPHARGREKSRSVKEIIDEINDLVKKGYKQIFLLGQNVNSYCGVISNSQSVTSKKGTTCKLPVTNYADFAYLLKKINAIPGKFWIHFLSSHPKDMTDKLIDIITKCNKVCEYIHLPIQAGDDEIIRRMNRKYTTKQYLSLITKFKKGFTKHKPGVPYVFSSDIIVGFPGETRKQFLKSAEIMEMVGYDMVFFGQFSRRPNTAAWNMKNNVSKKEKQRRENYLNEILKKTALSNSKKMLGKTVEALIEKNGDTGEFFGKTRTLKNVKILSNKKDLLGKIIKIKITKANIWNLEGQY